METDEEESSRSSTPASDQSERMCVSCGCPIRDKYVMQVTPDLHWHITCLACSECGKRLDEKITCFVRGGKTYCKEDYFRDGEESAVKDDDVRYKEEYY